jgi:hypothetical protein
MYLASTSQLLHYIHQKTFETKPMHRCRRATHHATTYSVRRFRHCGRRMDKIKELPTRASNKNNDPARTVFAQQPLKQ